MAGLFGDAIDTCDACLRYQPLHAKCFALRGKALEALGLGHMALREYVTALALDPGYKALQANIESIEGARVRRARGLAALSQPCDPAPRFAVRGVQRDATHGRRVGVWGCVSGAGAEGHSHLPTSCPRRMDGGDGASPPCKAFDPSAGLVVQRCRPRTPLGFGSWVA